MKSPAHHRLVRSRREFVVFPTDLHQMLCVCSWKIFSFFVMHANTDAISLLMIVCEHYLDSMFLKILVLFHESML